MSTQITGNVRTGTCPHGLPPGACPICNGMGGGGGSSRVNEHKPGELTWSQCYAIGQMMKAQKLAKEEAQAEALAQAQKSMVIATAQFAQQMRELMMKFLPAPVSNAVISAANNVIMPAIRFVQNLFNSLQTTLNNVLNTVKEKFVEITDKLTAMLGEMKAAVEKKISDKLRELKKKIFNLFGLSEADNEDEEKRVEEEKRLFDLKNLKETIFNSKNIEEESNEEKEDDEKDNGGEQ